MPSRPSLGACFQDLLSARFLPKRWLGRIWSADALPVRLQRCVRYLKPGYEWRAYGEADEIFFAIARLRDTETRATASPSLEVFFLDTNAAVYCAGVWERDPVHGWWLDSLVNLSYDTDHGWWLDAIADPKLIPENCGQLAPAVKRHSRDLLPSRASALPVKESP
jgi:hypothetical protein